MKDMKFVYDRGILRIIAMTKDGFGYMKGPEGTKYKAE